MSSDKGILNTTISQRVLNNFKNYCKEINCPMNTVLESFMKQFASGEFTIKIGKNNVEVDLND